MARTHSLDDNLTYNAINRAYLASHGHFKVHFGHDTWFWKGRELHRSERVKTLFGWASLRYKILARQLKQMQPDSISAKASGPVAGEANLDQP